MLHLASLSKFLINLQCYGLWSVGASSTLLNTSEGGGCQNIGVPFGISFKVSVYGVFGVNSTLLYLHLLWSYHGRGVLSNLQGVLVYILREGHKNGDDLSAQSSQCHLVP